MSLNRDIFPGRQLHRIFGRAVVHSTSMDVYLVSVNGNESVPLFKQSKKAGRIVVEMEGYLSFPESAKVTIIFLNTPFRNFSVPELFMEDLSDVVITEIEDESSHNDVGFWMVSNPPPSTNHNIISSQSGNAYFHRMFYLTFSDGQEIEVTATLIYPSSEQVTAGLFPTYYESYRKLSPRSIHVGMTLDEVLEAGWKIELTNAHDNEDNLVYWDGKSF